MEDRLRQMEAQLEEKNKELQRVPVPSPRPEQPLGRGSALSRLGAELELRRSGTPGLPVHHQPPEFTQQSLE